MDNVTVIRQFSFLIDLDFHIRSQLPTDKGSIVQAQNVVRQVLTQETRLSISPTAIT